MHNLKADQMKGMRWVGGGGGGGDRGWEKGKWMRLVGRGCE